MSDVSTWPDELFAAHEARQVEQAAVQAVTAEQPVAAISDPDEAGIAAWVHQRSPQPFTLEGMLTDLRGMSSSTKAEEMRAASCLRRLGWTQSRCTIDGRRAVWWRPVSAGTGEHEVGTQLVTHLDPS
jgi:hypothetical protein